MAANLWLFVYGTLRDPAVFRDVTGHLPDGVAQEATLPNHVRGRFSHLPYDYVEPREDAEVRGLLLEIRREDLEALDAYEDVRPEGDGLYRRILAPVRRGSDAVEAFVYVLGRRDGAEPTGA